MNVVFNEFNKDLIDENNYIRNYLNKRLIEKIYNINNNINIKVILSAHDNIFNDITFKKNYNETIRIKLEFLAYYYFKYFPKLLLK